MVRCSKFAVVLSMLVRFPWVPLIMIVGCSIELMIVLVISLVLSGLRDGP